MLWKKPWQPETMVTLIGGILAALVCGNLAVGLLHQARVVGFTEEDSAGSVLLATLSFPGAALVLGTVFLKLNGLGWREVLNTANWKRGLVLVPVVLVVVVPLVLGLKVVSELVLQKFHWAVADQRAVELLVSAKSSWLTAYLIFFAVVLAPLAEEFVFRGLLFSTAKRLGWPKTGAVGVSLLFALSHANAPAFLSLFVLALALTWLYEKTEGLLAPVCAHSLFNAANLLWLLFMEKHRLGSP